MRTPTIPTPSLAPFTLPLDPDDFRRAMSNGHGRTWMHVSQHGAAGMEAVLEHALLQSLAYESQLEGDRGSWVMAIVDESRTGTTLYPEFIRGVDIAPEDDYALQHISQRGTVLGELAKRGVAGARTALDQLFAENRTRYPDWLLGALDIIDVDGDQGLMQVCSALGHEAHRNNLDTVEDWFLTVFDRDRSEGAALKLLRAKRGVDLGIERFLSIFETQEARREAEVQAKEAQSGRPKALPTIQNDFDIPRPYHLLPVEEVISWIKNAPQQDRKYPYDDADGWRWLSIWGVRASGADLMEVLEELDCTDSPIELRRFLSIYSRRPMPRLSDKIIALAESEDTRVRVRACGALGNLADERIRAVALRSLTPEFMKTRSLKLFRSSYQPGDHNAIEQALFVPADERERYLIACDLDDICCHTRLPECLSLMLFVYEYSPSGLRRSRVIDAMVDLGVAPDWLAEECRFDAMEEIREKFGGPTLDG